MLGKLRKIFKKEEIDQVKIKRDNEKFMKKIKYSISYTAVSLFILIVAFLVLTKPPNEPPTKLLLITSIVFLSGFFGYWFHGINKNFNDDLDDTSNKQFKSELLSLYLKQSANKYQPDIFEKLMQYKIAKDETFKSNLFTEITKLIDKQNLDNKKNLGSDFNKPLHTKEKETLLIIIAALAGEAKIDLNMPSKSAHVLSKTSQQLGAYVSENTIADKLKLAKDLIEQSNKKTDLIEPQLNI